MMAATDVYAGDRPTRNWRTTAVAFTATVIRQEQEHTQRWHWQGQVITTESDFIFLETKAVVTTTSSRSSSSSGRGGTTIAVPQQWSSTYRPIHNGSTTVRQELGGFYTLLRFSTFQGRPRDVPGRSFSCRPLAELEVVGRCAAGDT